MSISSDVIKAKEAATTLAALNTDVKNNALRAMADALDKNRDAILSSNSMDVSDAETMESDGKLSNAMVKRLKIDDVKISGMIAGIDDVIGLPDPVGRTISTKELDDDLTLYQISCPIGMIGTIFESRPDVVPQIMSLCLKSGNAVIFKGGSEASRTNKTLFDILTKAAYSAGIPEGVFVLMERREDVNAILSMDQYIDLLIPRGSNSFVQYIRENTKIPVLGHASGICHIFIDESANIDMAVKVALDSKIQYPAVCNAVETLLVDSKIAPTFLPLMDKEYHDNNVEIRADKHAIGYMEHAKIAEESDWDTEYGDLVISIAVVDDMDEAITFINEHGSHHTDAIISNDKDRISRFIRYVDSADVFVNASTRFADGYRFGKGAEVGISTNKIHSRGPVGMEGLMIYKYVLIGEGQIVKDYVGKDARPFTHKDINKELEL